VNCLVSGATGFIGRQICQRLLARGDSVVALSKSGIPLANGLPTVAVDLALDEPDAGLLSGIDVVIHLAGIAHQQAPALAYERLNVQGTLCLARLASAAGVKRFIYLSSVKAMGIPGSMAIRTEKDCSPPRDAYGRSKWQAECALRSEFADDPMSVVILRPALVYGRNVKGNLQRLSRAVQRGLPRPPAAGQRSMIALDDLVELVLDLMLTPLSGVHTWIACGDTAYSTRSIYDMLRRANGKGKGIGWLPHWAWRAAGNLLDVLITRGDEATYDKLFGTEVYSNAAVRTATGWRPDVGLEDVIDNVSWMDVSGS
jgi:nucleoside-diphosphate-sugar epimerase